MIWLLLGALTLLLLVAGLRAFERASISSIKLLFAWIAALAGLTLTLLLILTGRGPLAFFALSLLYPLIREHWLARRPRVSAGTPPPGSGAARPGGPMSVAEAYEVLGLKAGAGEAEIQEAYRRLMRAAHPDSGGSDWLAARINQARDILLGKSGRRQ
jgi:hypothetical protein